MNMTLTLCVMAVYFLTLTALGIYKSTKIKTQSDFSVAGRTLSPWILVGTMLATWVGTGSILGNAGKTYSTGLAAFILPIGSILGIVLLTQIAGRVRNFEKFTVPEIIADRYGEVARILSVFALVTAYMVIVSYQYNAGGAVIETMLKGSDYAISKEWAVIFAAVFIITYTMLAGLVSVAYTDVGNGIIMVASLAIAFPFVWSQAGGWDGMQLKFDAMTVANQLTMMKIHFPFYTLFTEGTVDQTLISLSQVDKSSHMQFWGVYSWMQIISFTLPPFLLILGDANMYQRFFASKSAKGAKQATIVLIFVVAIVEILIIACAWVSSSMIPNAEQGKNVLIVAAHQFFPPILSALTLTTIIGIIISTADSYLLVPATTMVRDIYQNYINPNAEGKQVVFLSRFAVLILGLIAYFVSIGFGKSETFFTKALYAYTIYGAGITPCLVAALFWKKASTAGAVASILSGTIVTILWSEASSVLAFLRQSEETINYLVNSSLYTNTDAVLPAIFASVFSLVVFSLLKPNSLNKS